MVIELKKDEKKIYNLSKDNISEELYQKIVHDVGEGISVSDDNGYFLVFNPRLEEITGYTKIEANEHKNKLFLDKLYPDVELRAKVAEHIDQIPENHHYTNIKTLIKTKSGDDKPMLVSSTAITHKQKKYYLTAYRDVSEKPAVE
jgi:PAS domain S-box-containing protein